MNLDPTATFVVVLLIGVVVGLAFDQFAGPGWMTRQIAGKQRTLITSILIGIAGAFIGENIGALLRLSGTVQLVCAVIGAAVVLWGWRMAR